MEKTQFEEIQSRNQLAMNYEGGTVGEALQVYYNSLKDVPVLVENIIQAASDKESAETEKRHYLRLVTEADKKNAVLSKVVDLACAKIAKDEGQCPYAMGLTNNTCKESCAGKCTPKIIADAWRSYFTKLIEEDKGE